MKILITGASGFVGSHLMSDLKNKKQIIALPPTIDLTNKKQLFTFAKKNPAITTIIHLASHIPSKSNDMTDPFYVENISGTVNLISAFSHIKKFVFASTLDVYGKPDHLPVTEKITLNPQSPYGISKLASEYYLKQAKNIDQLIILRFTQIYGPEEKKLKAIPHFIHALKNKQQPVLYGKGNEKRDYLYIKDAIQAIEKSLTFPDSGIFNIATGISHSIKEVLTLILSLSKTTLKPRYEIQQKESYHLEFDISKAKRKLNFKPDYPLEKGLGEYIRYYNL